MERTVNHSAAWISRILTLLGVIIAIAILSACSMRGKSYQAPIFENIGNYRMDVTFTSKEAKQFFDQGMIFTYGYNHGEAARSFREAIRLDSSFAMAYWGLAYTLGPNYNAPLDPASIDEILWATDKATDYKEGLTDWEAGLIEASMLKYTLVNDEPDLEAIAEKMEDLIAHHPENAELLTHYAEVLMLQHPWDLYDYKGGPAKKWTPDILNTLKKSLQVNPDHPLTNHLYIHATEAATLPDEGWEAAEMLSNVIIPGAGHLVHMPSHTYINTGDYHLGTEVNLAAVSADSLYVTQCRVQGAFPLYYYHNYHFLAACAALEGRGALAIESSFKMTNVIDRNQLNTPGFETSQHFMTVPYNVLVKFAQWEKILALPAPDADYPYITAIWHYARGMALANSKRLSEAKEELALLNRLKGDDNFSDFLIFGINSGQLVADIASLVLEAEILIGKGEYIEAEQILLEAVELEDSMSYNEPPDWFFSVRHTLGDVYMSMSAYEKAEQVYRQDLKNFPKNGFAMNGLVWSLIHQYKLDEAKPLQKEIDKIWQYADSPLRYSRIDPDSRKELTLKVKSDYPKDLALIAANLCGIY